ncbi:MAG: HlyD family efflux transporter periplasmic adaptor subunit [Pirellulales bacterium]|nr:HlyD family efflux transporter periplasmic adaptor subunit [Pirellulales bacterium]
MNTRHTGPIPIPLKIRWQRFRYAVLPVLTFTVLLITTAILWQYQGVMPNTIGRVEAVRVNVASVTDGRLIPLRELGEGQWQPFDAVEAGQVVARLDDQPLRALLTALRGDAAAFRAELEATQTETALDQADRQQDHLRRSTDLQYQVERYRLDVLDRQAVIEEDQLELTLLNSRLAVMKRARSAGMLTEAEIADVEAEHQRVTALWEAHTASLKQAQEDLEAAAERLKGYPPLEQPDVDKLLAPIRESIAAAEARAEEVRAQIDMMELRAPVSGVISAIHLYPGQAAKAGEWIMTIAADKADHITAYVRPEQRLRPTVKMPVGVRARVPGQRMLAAAVESVGAQWEPMPLELLRDQRIPELVLPVRVTIPQDLKVRPGEIVDIRFLLGGT